LRTGALAEWDKATALSHTPAEKAETEYVRGWGLWLLERHSLKKPAIFAAEVPHDWLEETAAPKETMVLLEAATHDAPDSALYWQSLGDADADHNHAATAYHRSLDLDAHNPALWYRLY